MDQYTLGVVRRLNAAGNSAAVTLADESAYTFHLVARTAMIDAQEACAGHSPATAS